MLMFYLLTDECEYTLYRVSRASTFYSVILPIQDYMQIAEREGYTFVLYVRKDGGTALGKDLQCLVDAKKIILKEIP